jgi:hypothetical protein
VFGWIARLVAAGASWLRETAHAEREAPGAPMGVEPVPPE